MLQQIKYLGLAFMIYSMIFLGSAKVQPGSPSGRFMTAFYKENRLSMPEAILGQDSCEFDVDRLTYAIKVSRSTYQKDHIEGLLAIVMILQRSVHGCRQVALQEKWSALNSRTLAIMYRSGDLLPGLLKLPDSSREINEILDKSQAAANANDYEELGRQIAIFLRVLVTVETQSSSPQ